MALVPYHGARTLQVWGLCDLSFEIFVQLTLFFSQKRKFPNFDPPPIFGSPNFSGLKDLVTPRQT